MPKNLSVASVIEKNRVASNVAWLPLLEIDVVDPATNLFVETLYFARNPEDITFQSHTYTKGAFDFNLTMAASQQPTVSVTAHDLTRAIQARMQQYGGGIGFTVRILVVNTANLAQPAEVQETFTVVGSSAKGYDVTFQLGAENPLTLRCPRRRQFRDQCQWRYKGPECGYVGNLPTCDFTLLGINGCAAHNIQQRFGGFPGIGISITGQ